LSHNNKNISGLIFGLRKLKWKAAQGTSKAVNDKSFRSHHSFTRHSGNKTKIWFSAPLITTVFGKLKEKSVGMQLIQE
jgi:hypothetical protein